jgi:hypothetical protein
MSNHKQFLTACSSCGATTSRAYARGHNGACKACTEGVNSRPTREQRILEHGYQAYAREEGHYDTPDNY